MKNRILIYSFFAVVLVVLSSFTFKSVMFQQENPKKSQQDTLIVDTIAQYKGKFKPFKKSVHASYYADKFHGRRTASGKLFDMNKLTAAHKTLPFGTMVKVTNESNGKSVVVEINDRGPFVRGREIDLSKKAFLTISSGGGAGYIKATLEVLQK